MPTTPVTPNGAGPMQSALQALDQQITLTIQKAERVFAELCDIRSSIEKALKDSMPKTPAELVCAEFRCRKENEVRMLTPEVVLFQSEHREVEEWSLYIDDSGMWRAELFIEGYSENAILDASVRLCVPKAGSPSAVVNQFALVTNRL